MKTILLVEDDQFLRDLTFKALAQALGADVDVQIADTGNKAIEKMNELKDKLNLILLDIILPDKNGYEILEFIQQDQTLRAVPVIVLSNLGQPEEIEKAKNLGARDFMIKAQSDTAEIVAKVKQYLA